MYPPIYATVKTSLAVQAALGEDVRLFPFGRVPQGTPAPYGVWQLVPGGSPENYLGNLPDIDSMLVQVDVYATTDDDAREAAKALRDAIEPHAHIVSWRGEDTDTETDLAFVSFDVRWWVPR